MKRQQGFGLVSTAIIGVIAIFVLLLGFKLVPVFTEYLAIKKAFNSAVTEVPGDAAIGDFRRAFQRYSDVNDITSLRPEDLEITRDSGVVTIEASYERRVSLFANAALVLTFNVSDSGQGGQK